MRIMDRTKKASPAARIQGTIKSFDPVKRQGIITREGGKDVSLHADAVEGGKTEKLKAGTRVEYVVEDGPKGPRATSVRVL